MKESACDKNLIVVVFVYVNDYLLQHHSSVLNKQAIMVE